MIDTVHQVGVTLILKRTVSKVCLFLHNQNPTKSYPACLTSLAYAFADILILTDLAAHAPVQVGRALLGSAEKSHTQRGPDLCRNTS
jgi:hypothetical protein